jgi:DNA 3'-phosphatase
MIIKPPPIFFTSHATMSSKTNEAALFLPTSFTPTNKFYLFDVDGTLITSRSGKQIAQNADDIVYIGDIKDTFDALQAAGFTILLVTNQAIWNDDSKSKIRHLHETFNVPVVVATGKGSSYRKPSPKLWELFCEAADVDPTNITDLRMVGDAAGPTSSYLSNRWADTDLGFANAIGAEFEQPQEVFSQVLPPRLPLTQFLTLMMGTPGSGKSTLAKKLAESTGAVHVEQDAYKTKRQVEVAVKTALSQGSSVIVDATHGNRERRAEWWALADKHDAEKHVVWCVRDGRPYNEARPVPVSRIVYNVYTSKFSDPREDPEVDKVHIIY